MFDLTLPARTPLPQPPFLPTTRAEMDAIGGDTLDILLVTGDAYVDHPSFGVPLLGRWLVGHGYRVGIVAQPRWKDEGQGIADLARMGRPRLFAGVSAGALDSMLAHYTAFRKKRHDDAYTPGGKAGFRPDRAVTVYSQILKRLYPHVPVVIGGIEASLRRLTHYDYWSDALKPSILAESGADLLIYGMGERVVQQVARAMRNGYNAKLLRKLRQVAFMADDSYVQRLDPAETIRLHAYEECVRDKRAFGENFTIIETQSNLMEPTATLIEAVGDRYVVVTPPNTTLSTDELDHSFDLPYQRAPHPRYPHEAIIEGVDVDGVGRVLDAGEPGQLHADVRHGKRLGDLHHRAEYQHGQHVGQGDVPQLHPPVADAVDGPRLVLGAIDVLQPRDKRQEPGPQGQPDMHQNHDAQAHLRIGQP